MGGKTFSGKTAGAIKLAANSRSSRERTAPEWELFSEARQHSITNWLQETHRTETLNFDLPASEHFFERYLQQLSTLHFDHRGLQFSQVKDFIHQTGQLIDESIERDDLQQAGINIGALATHLDPNFRRQEFIDRVSHLSQVINFDYYTDQVREELKYSDPNGQEMDRQVSSYINEHGLEEDDRPWVADEIRSAIIEDPRYNHYYSLDLEQYDQWLIERHHESLGSALEDCQAPDWLSIIVHQDEINSYPEQLIEALSGYKPVPSDSAEKSAAQINPYSPEAELERFLFDAQAKVFCPTQRA